LFFQTTQLQFRQYHELNSGRLIAKFCGWLSRIEKQRITNLNPDPNGMWRYNLIKTKKIARSVFGAYQLRWIFFFIDLVLKLACNFFAPLSRASFVGGPHIGFHFLQEVDLAFLG